ncbi:MULTISPECIES: hypothetical protein [Francisella]|uniref:Uncharacterized protein n=1 Tax=Francisella opportunistica TaxID=2016517 RepID=A0A345JRY2_9GAMM|nr:MULTISPECIES: hypothetical protein [Francisella]APC91835.1 hypothetical protein BBG19_1101 [Francisella sp. MA067296]AXH30078.1 hypothetical protein CGC43_05530 [Francisella opportunistica]AXH31722.1 hypothetical protein CGC44_05520 [Francisella opportunistica]AXH33368.1 hypothetical protein CGC45_05530 [Francisella opportunistica]
MINAQEVFIKFSEDKIYEQGIADIRKLLTRFVSNNRLSLSDLTFLASVANYYMQASIVKMNKTIDPFFNEESDSPLLDSCAEFRHLCDLLEYPTDIKFIKSLANGKRISSKKVFLNLNADQNIDECISEIRSILTLFKKSEMISLYDICVLNRACNYLLANSVVMLRTLLNNSFDEKKEKCPILELLVEYSMLCEYLLNIDSVLESMPGTDEEEPVQSSLTLH